MAVKSNPFDPESLRVYVEEVAFMSVSNPLRTSFGFRASCPVCHEGGSGSRKRRFQFYADTHSAYCFNAGCPLNGSGASDLTLTALLKGIPRSMEAAEYMKWFGKNSGRVMQSAVDVAIDRMGGPPSEEPSRDVATKDAGMFEDSWVDLPPSVRRYCEDRKMFGAPFAPPDWRLYLCTSSRRLVIPWMEDGRIIYYQKRALLRGDSPKYVYPASTSRPIFNVDLVDESFPYVFCTEGAIDCCFLKNGVACGGLVPSASQREELRERFPGFRIVILTDNQWIDRSARAAMEGSRGMLFLSRFDFDFFIWPRESKAKDVNESVCMGESCCRFDDAGWLKEHSYDALQANVMLSM